MQLLAARRKKLGISLTALIDVVFILLMFFMLTSSFVRVRAFDLLAPVAGDSSDQPPQLVLLGNDDRLTLFDGRLLASSYQQLEVLERSLLDPAQPLVLVPAAEVQVQAIVATLEGLSRAGFAISLGDSQPANGEVAP